jgi:small subunit ribosomal protein S3
LGQKVHPYGFRLGIFKDWQAKWYAERDYAKLLQQDLKLRQAIEKKCYDGGIARMDLERLGEEIQLTLYSARPGILIGRGGQNVAVLKTELEKLSGERIGLTIKEVERPEIEASLVARNVADRIERGVPFRRVMKQAIYRTMQAGAKGIKVRCKGRLGGREIARAESLHEGQMPLHTLRADIDYGFTEAHTVMGRIGVKVWIYKGEVLPELRRESATTEASEIPQGS